MAHTRKRKKQSHPARRSRLQQQAQRAAIAKESDCIHSSRTLSHRLGNEIDRLIAKLGVKLKRFWDAKADESNK